MNLSSSAGRLYSRLCTLNWALDTDGNYFKYLCESLPALCYEKIKAGVFDGPQIRQLMKDNAIPNSMNETERPAWLSFVSVDENFLGNSQYDDYRNIVETMLENYHKFGCNMSIKVHFLNSHLEQFTDNLGAVDDEQAKRFRQDSYGREIPKMMGYPHDGRLLLEY